MNAPSPSPREQQRQSFWRTNRQITAVLLLFWFLVTYLASFYADELNQIVILGFPLGFYMAAQGSLIVYVVIVGAYALCMRRLEKKHGIEDTGG